MPSVVLEHSGLCCLSSHACQKKMYIVNKILLGNWMGVGLACWKEAFGISILLCYVLASPSSAVSEGCILQLFGVVFCSA